MISYFKSIKHRSMFGSYYTLKLVDREGIPEPYRKEAKIAEYKLYLFLKEQGFDVRYDVDANDLEGHAPDDIKLKLHGKADKAKFNLINVGLFEITYDENEYDIFLPQIFKVK
jgi:hypothetical protein